MLKKNPMILILFNILVMDGDDDDIKITAHSTPCKITSLMTHLSKPQSRFLSQCCFYWTGWTAY